MGDGLHFIPIGNGPLAWLDAGLAPRLANSGPPFLSIVRRLASPGQRNEGRGRIPLASRPLPGHPVGPMNFDDVLLCGVKRHVLALDKRTGVILWETKLPGGTGNGFVSVVTDGNLVCAHANGQVHGLDFATGRLLWTNGLSGYGYGLASLNLPGFGSSPDAATAAQLAADEESARSAQHSATTS